MRFSIFLSGWFVLLLECHCWVVIKFPQVKELYSSERASKYSYSKLIKDRCGIMHAGSGKKDVFICRSNRRNIHFPRSEYRRRWGGDPFMKKSTKELKQYCNEIRTSGVYSTWNDAGTPPPMVTMPDILAPIEHTRELKYQYQQVVGERDPVPMFPCLTYDGYWYLSYGFNDDYLFVFQNLGMDEKSGGPLYEVQGILERSPKLDRSMLRGNVLESSLSNSLTAANRSPLPELWGKSSHHFRLCSLVLDAIRKAYSGQRYFTINFGQDYDDQTPVRRPLMFQFLNKKDFSLEAIPCAMNRSFLRPNFLVTPNPNDPQSVYVFLEKEDLVDNQTKYVTTYLVRDVSALRNWST